MDDDCDLEGDDEYQVEQIEDEDEQDDGDEEDQVIGLRRDSNSSQQTITSSGLSDGSNLSVGSTVFRNKMIQNIAMQKAAMSKVPITNDGMGVCIRCGNIGVKDTFYGKGKQFCSANCVRGLPPGGTSAPVFKIMTITGDSKTPKIVPKSSLTPLTHSSSQSNVQSQPSIGKKKIPISSKNIANQSSSSPHQINSSVKKQQIKGKPLSASTTTTKTQSYNSSSYSFDWMQLLNDSSLKGAPVTSFPHAPMADCWDSLVTVGLKLEVKNKDFPAVLSKSNQEIHWIASVIKIAGYMVLLRYEGFGNDSSKDFWVNIFTTQVHPVGWCASQGKALIPPKTIEERCPDWKGYLVKRLTGSKTLPYNFYEQIKESLKSRFKISMKLEVVDKNRISAVRVASIDEIIGGRIHVQYEGADESDEGFWCHQRSALIHPVGWAQVVGHELRATQEYARTSLQKAIKKQFDDDDAPWNLFSLPTVAPSEHRFKEGMKLEAIDPLNLATICVATVTKVLRHNYLMIGIDGMMAANGSDWFCYHASSPYIFPCGYCSLNDLTLTPPRGYNKEFNWFQYLRETKSMAASVPLFHKDIPKHGFKEGMYLEAVDLMEPRLICVATITKVIGRLLRIHFIGWDENYDQWCDCESPDLYPIGWCQLVGYPLEPPKYEDSSGSQNITPDSKRKRNLNRGRSAKKKKRNSTSQSQSGKDQSFEEFSFNEWKLPSSCQDQTITSSASTNSSTMSISNIIDSNSSVIIKPSPLIRTSDEILGPDPTRWSPQEVASFLKSNDCGAYSDAFLKQKVDGEKFLSLTREDLIKLTLILGPSLKIHALIESLNNKKY